MADIEAYYSAIREEQVKLDKAYPRGYVFTTSLRNISKGSTAGTVAEVSNRTAAKLLADGVARVSTVEEIDQFQAAATAFNDEMTKKELARNPMTSLVKALTGRDQ